MNIGKADIEALQRILQWAEDQAVMTGEEPGAPPAKEAAPASIEVEVGMPEEEEVPMEDEGEPYEEEEEMPRASHFGSHRFGGGKPKQPMQGKRR